MPTCRPFNCDKDRVNRLRTRRNVNGDKAQAIAKRVKKEEQRKVHISWEEKIKKLYQQGYSAKSIYYMNRGKIFQELGFDPKAMIEKLTGEKFEIIKPTKNNEMER